MWADLALLGVAEWLECSRLAGPLSASGAGWEQRRHPRDSAHEVAGVSQSFGTSHRRPVLRPGRSPIRMVWSLGSHHFPHDGQRTACGSLGWLPRSQCCGSAQSEQLGQRSQGTNVCSHMRPREASGAARKPRAVTSGRLACERCRTAASAVSARGVSSSRDSVRASRPRKVGSGRRVAASRTALRELVGLVDWVTRVTTTMLGRSPLRRRGWCDRGKRRVY